MPLRSGSVSSATATRAASAHTHRPYALRLPHAHAVVLPPAHWHPVPPSETEQAEASEDRAGRGVSHPSLGVDVGAEVAQRAAGKQYTAIMTEHELELHEERERFHLKKRIEHHAK